MCKQIKSPLMGKKEEGRELHNRLQTIYIYIYIYIHAVNMKYERESKRQKKGEENTWMR